MFWDWVYAIKIFVVYVRIVLIFLAGRIVTNVGKLTIEFVCFSYAMFVVSAVPNFAWGL